MAKSRALRAVAFTAVTALLSASPTSEAQIEHAAQSPAADVTIGDVARWDASAFWSRCDAGPSGQVCTSTQVLVSRVVDGHEQPATYMVVYRATYAEGDGTILSEDRWVGPAELSVDRQLNTATANAVVATTGCGDPPSPSPSNCENLTHEVSAAWTASGEATTSTERLSGYEGIYRGSGIASMTERPAVATGTVDRDVLGDAQYALLRERHSRSLFLARQGGSNGLGEPFGEPWFQTGFDTQLRLAAAWDSCGDAAMLGDVCTATRITAHGMSIHEYSDWLIFRREVYEVGENGERHTLALSTGEGPAELTRDANSRGGAVNGVVGALECVPGGPPPPGAPPGTPDCRIVNHEISASWMATGQAARRGEFVLSKDSETRRWTKVSEEQVPAIATGTINADALGESDLAVIQTASYLPAAKEPVFDDTWIWRDHPDAETAVYAHWDTCAGPPGPGDICTQTTFTAYGLGATGAELHFEQITYTEEGVLCIVLPISTIVPAALSVDRNLASARFAAAVSVNECFPPQPGQTEWDCAVVESNISVDFSGIDQSVRSESGRIRFATAIGTMTGTQNPDDVGEIKTFGLIARRTGTN